MFKKWTVVLIICCNFYVSAQQSNAVFKSNIETHKQQNNYAEFIYVHLDEFGKNPSVENLNIFTNLELKLWRKPENDNENIALLYFYINYAYQLKQFGFLNNSINYYEKGYSIYESKKIKYDIIEFCLKPLSNNYTRLGDSNRAEDILKITIEKAQEENRLDQIISGYTNLAVVFRTKGEVSIANRYLNSALELDKENKFKSKIYSDLAINFLLMEDFKKSEENALLSNKLNKQKELSISVRNSKTLGNCFIHKNELERALLEFEKSLNAAKVVFGKNDREVAKIYNQIAEVYRLQNENEMALAFSQNSLVTLLPNYNPKDIYENPLSTFLYAENTLKEVFDSRAQILTQINKFKEAIENYELSFLVETELRNAYLSQNSKLLQQQENRNRSESCIELCQILFEQTGALSWVEKAFQFAEQTKSLVLLENKELTLAKSAIKNDSLFIKEKELVFNKAQLNKSITLEQLKNENADIVLLSQLTKKREAVFNKLQLLKQEINNKYPNLKLENKFITVKNIKEKLLKKEEVLIEYFDGVNNIYMFSISKEKSIHIETINKTIELQEQISNFLNLFAKERGAEIQNNVTNYVSLGYELYKKIGPEELSKTTIIIPDGIFSFLPFDALIAEKTESTNFQKLPYLINKTNISYGYSASILLSNSNAIAQKENKFIGFFPVFKNNNRNLSELNYTEKEARSIEDEIEGEFLLFEKAKKNAFEKIKDEYNIIHLSTHATAGDNYIPAAIEFYDETLYLPEVYGYNLNSDLLILSACETGIGALKRGEGVMSLARGFSYAGVKNLIVSLWKVNDKSTENLIAGFYKKFKKSGNKSSALRHSKLAYLQNESISSVKKSPYYWASFIYIGDTDLKEKSNYYLSWFMLFGFIIIIAGYFIYKKS
ncbi:CHAT domain-containing protein [Lutibacter flavus]|uniref:CHAT domain-containing protein n=1 Tax=Lutibacter flavus TaxID=691689 RepID=A0A238XC80_9FLAO|nr:CHAT domain-containing tetratricopeptide repeat protein [Lutibacter flavus]SNR56310.1 CHAT domain-containing protein [Lutibacter flavus]